MKLFKIKRLYYICIGLVFALCNNFVLAQPLEEPARNELVQQTNVFRNNSGFQFNATIADITKAVIQGFLGLLGIIFVVLMVVAGYNWMTAGGDEEKLKTAKKMISRAIYGLIITVFAYAITYFVFSNIPVDGSGGGGLGPGGT